MVNLRECILWYQKKIGTYDKEEWEKSIERKILSRLNTVPLKNAKKLTRESKTDFIDVDLIRGSTFPKTKPKHGLVTVTKLAILRLFLLPIFSKWWISQTSFRIFLLFLLLYIGQTYNFVIYILKIVQSNYSSECFEYHLSAEIFVPLVIMMVLSIVHAQIVSTTTNKKNYFKNKKLDKRSSRKTTRNNTSVVNETNGCYSNGNEFQNSRHPDIRFEDLVANLRLRKGFDVPDTEELSDVQRNRETMNASPDNCWMETTTNSDEGSGYNSDYDESDSVENCEGQNVNDRTYWKYNMEPSSILNSRGSSSDRINCTIWEDKVLNKADLSVLDISSLIISRAEELPESLDYLYIGMFFSLILTMIAVLYRLGETVVQPNAMVHLTDSVTDWDRFFLFWSYDNVFHYLSSLIYDTFAHSDWERRIVVIAMFERLILSIMFFFLLAVAENTFRQRFILAKLFSHLTSFRRARKSNIPHFRLNKVRNIKAWLSIRSYLKKRGPQRSVDVIVSTVFIAMFLLLSFISVEFLKDSVSIHSQFTLEATIWCLGLGIFLLRFMTLGTKINRKYRNLSVLLTEQINLYLQIEQKPHKKDELMVANSVLKLAADLLKELESPFKISGLSANPHFYTITKVVILSALSGVLSEVLGFKLKLHKIKIK